MRFFYLLLLLFTPLCGGVPLDLLQKVLDQGLTIDLKEVKYEKGVIFTEEGGVITGPGLRIQGRNLYLSFEEEQGAVVIANGDLLVEYGCYTFVGEEFMYDFEKKWGLLKCGTAGLEPWFFKSSLIELLPNGDIGFKNSLITTTEEDNPAWSLIADEAVLENRRYIKAFGLRLQVGKIPLFWLPWFKGDLHSLLDHPIKYRIRWGGEQGLRIGMIFNFFSWGGLDLSFRFDWRFKRGPGVSIESDFVSNDGRTYANTINYVALDNSIENLKQQLRFRYQGIFGHTTADGRTHFRLTYDKLSDNQMSVDYFERDLELKTGKRTEASIVHISPSLLTSLYTRVKINNFQTVKQELPSLNLTPYPTIFERWGWIMESRTDIGFLDYRYAKEVPSLHSYRAGRFFFEPKIYNTSSFGPLVVTSTLGGIGIAYSHRPKGGDFAWVGVGQGEIEGKVRLKRNCGIFSHTIEPYLKVVGYTPPTLSPNHHFIFDIEDGWSSLQYTRFGMRNLLFAFGDSSQPVRSLTADLYSNLFLGKTGGSDPIPKIHFDLLFDPTPSIRQVVESAWDLNHQQLDHLNVRLDWTLNENIALGTEYRTRSRYSWRKLDPNNYFLDSYRNVQSLLHSTVSDQRDTFLWRSFFRFHPNLALQLELRRGWHRKKEANYTEYEIDLLTTIRSIWELRISYQKKEDDHRVALYFNLHQDRPCR